MSATSKAIMAMCVLLLAALVTYYGMTPQAPLDLPPAIYESDDVSVSAFDRDIDGALERMGIPLVQTDASADSLIEATAPTHMPDSIEAAPPIEKVAAVPMPPLPAPTSPRTWMVREGDTLAGIAESQLGSEARWSEIASLNGLDPDAWLRIGQELMLPQKTAAAAPEPTLPIPADAVTHVVQEGETLSDIAAAYLGSALRWDTIFEANRERLSSPDRVRAGMTIVIPSSS